MEKELFVLTHVKVCFLFRRELAYQSCGILAKNDILISLAQTEEDTEVNNGLGNQD